MAMILERVLTERIAGPAGLRIPDRSTTGIVRSLTARQCTLLAPGAVSPFDALHDVGQGRFGDFVVGSATFASAG